MTASRNVAHSLERAGHMHSGHTTEKKNEKLKKTIKNNQRKIENREKDAVFEPDGQKDMLT